MRHLSLYTAACLLTALLLTGCRPGGTPPEETTDTAATSIPWSFPDTPPQSAAPETTAPPPKGITKQERPEVVPYTADLSQIQTLHYDLHEVIGYPYYTTDSPNEGNGQSLAFPDRFIPLQNGCWAEIHQVIWAFDANDQYGYAAPQFYTFLFPNGDKPYTYKQIGGYPVYRIILCFDTGEVMHAKGKFPEDGGIATAEFIRDNRYSRAASYNDNMYYYYMAGPFTPDKQHLNFALYDRTERLTEYKYCELYASGGIFVGLFFDKDGELYADILDEAGQILRTESGNPREAYPEEKNDYGSDGLTALRDTETGLYYYANAAGQAVCPPTFTACTQIKNGTAVVQIGETTYMLAVTGAEFSPWLSDSEERLLSTAPREYGYSVLWENDTYQPRQADSAGAAWEFTKSVDGELILTDVEGDPRFVYRLRLSAGEMSYSEYVPQNAMPTPTRVGCRAHAAYGDEILKAYEAYPAYADAQAHTLYAQQYRTYLRDAPTLAQALEFYQPQVTEHWRVYINGQRVRGLAVQDSDTTRDSMQTSSPQGYEWRYRLLYDRLYSLEEIETIRIEIGRETSEPPLYTAEDFPHMTAEQFIPAYAQGKIAAKDLFLASDPDYIQTKLDELHRHFTVELDAQFGFRECETPPEGAVFPERFTVAEAEILSHDTRTISPIQLRYNLGDYLLYVGMEPWDTWIQEPSEIQDIQWHPRVVYFVPVSEGIETPYATFGDISLYRVQHPTYGTTRLKAVQHSTGMCIYPQVHTAPENEWTITYNGKNAIAVQLGGTGFTVFDFSGARYYGYSGYPEPFVYYHVQDGDGYLTGQIQWQSETVLTGENGKGKFTYPLRDYPHLVLLNPETSVQVGKDPIEYTDHSQTGGTIP